MNTQRLNITMPQSLAAQLREKPNKSAFIAEAVREKIEAEDSELRKQALAKAYHEAAAENGRALEDWDALSGENL